MNDVCNDLMAMPDTAPGGGTFHSGFLRAVRDDPVLHSTLRAHVSAAQRLYVMGHSLGGSLALTLWGAGLLPPAASRVAVVALGSPAVFHGEPALTAAGCAATARYLLAVSSSARGHEVDPAAVRKLLGLLTKACAPGELQELSFPAFSESSVSMVRVAALQATAQLQQAVTEQPEAYGELAKQLAPSLPSLRDCWLSCS